uniref:U1 small nuclear ribonucleoprotein C n=1 Tax=Lygus hesperus TaxID=30085 RepID=A0A0A9ZDJ6_LYGHE
MPYKPIDSRYYCKVCNTHMGNDTKTIRLHDEGKRHKYAYHQYRMKLLNQEKQEKTKTTQLQKLLRQLDREAEKKRKQYEDRGGTADIYSSTTNIHGGANAQQYGDGVGGNLYEGGEMEGCVPLENVPQRRIDTSNTTAEVTADAGMCAMDTVHPDRVAMQLSASKAPQDQPIAKVPSNLHPDTTAAQLYKTGVGGDTGDEEAEDDLPPGLFETAPVQGEGGETRSTTHTTADANKYDYATGMGLWEEVSAGHSTPQNTPTSTDATQQHRSTVLRKASKNTIPKLQIKFHTKSVIIPKSGSPVAGTVATVNQPSAAPAGSTNVPVVQFKKRQRVSR